jgi:hydrogenase maturation protein HypF
MTNMKRDYPEITHPLIDDNRIKRLRIEIEGAVQGVGFRPFIYRLAVKSGLTGWIRNSARGAVIEAEGPAGKLNSFIAAIDNEKPNHSLILNKKISFLKPRGDSDFSIAKSDSHEHKTALVLPDIATCDECLAEIFDPGNRRYRYPFTNCTNCGPRFSIIESLPYDRRNTSMKAFPMCEECLSEYNDPTDRRFHAQPNACPKCGPHLELWDGSGNILELYHNALLETCDLVRRGKIVAVKGLGGFHLMADASNGAAVTRLRNLKGREEKPFAMMYPDLRSAKRDCFLTGYEEHLLCSSESPIMLLKRKFKNESKWFGISSSVAPGNPYLGIMLPYTPLHHLLMAELRHPVVATSGNISEETICTDEYEALKRLGGIADFFLVHNRPIVRPIDDSVVFVINDRETILRRARGYAPLPIQLKKPLSPVLAVGGHLKNTVAISVGEKVFLSQHIGDLENRQSFDTFTDSVDSLCGLYDFKPQTVAHDSHPDYASSKYAVNLDLPGIKVQHHYAHVLSCMAENGLEGPVLGVCWDGTGYGPDGTVWGGEFLKVNDRSFSRIAHLRTFHLPGNEKAIREPRRSALGVLFEIYGEDVLDMKNVLNGDGFRLEERKNLIKMIKSGINSPVTSSIGRLFDAAASIVGLCHVASFEGQAAMRLEYAIGDLNTDETYEYEINKADDKYIIDWESMIRAIVDDMNESVDAGKIAAKFHNALVEMIVDVAEIVNEKRIVLSGGCFQNRYLIERTADRLQARGFESHRHHLIPPNDGGLALGQIVAASRTESEG